MKTETNLRPRRDGGRQPHRNMQRSDFITMFPGLTSLFVVWREGARMPQSFHLTENDAVQLAGRRCPPGTKLNILRAELVGQVEATQPVIQYLKGEAKA